MDLSINVVEDVLMRTLTSTIEFDKFCENLDDIGSLLDDSLYLEDVENLGPKGRRTRQKIAKNTIDTTKGAVKLYDDVTDIGGIGIKSGWDLMMKLVSLAVSILNFIVKNIVRIPQLIIRLIDMIQSIPENVRDLIRGNIKLYITVNDIELLYNQGLYGSIDAFINQCEILSRGAMWTKLMQKIGNVVRPGEWGKAESFSNDMNTCKEMKKLYNKFRAVNFKQVTIDMNNPNMVDLYFGNKKIEIHDLHGKTRQFTYYEALEQLVTDINNRKNTLLKLQTDLGEKFAKSQDNQTFATLSPRSRQTVIDTIQMVSKVAEIIGNMTKCIMSDITTIQKTTEQILKRQKELESGHAGKKIIGRNDKGIKDVDVNALPQDVKAYYDQMKKEGRVKVSKYVHDASGNVVQEINGIVDKYDDHCVWVLKKDVPRGVKVLS